MLRSSGIKTITRNIRTKDEKYLQPKPTLQRRPGDWYGGPTGDRNWNHLINTKKDIHSLIKLERLEFPTDRAKNCKDYFNKLIEIARNKERQPNYSSEQLNWWLSEGGVPASWLIHERYEEKPIKHVPGLREKFLSIVNRQQEGEIVSVHEIGDYDIKESIYAGDGFAKGIFEDPETLYYPIKGKQTKNYSVVELAGNPYPELPIPRPDGRTLENVLIRSLSKN